MAKEVPIAEKSLLTPEEAAAYFNIGVNKIRMMTDGPVVLMYYGVAAED